MFASPKVIRFVCLLFNFQTRRSLEILAVFDMDQMITYYIVCIHFAIFFPSFAISYLGGKESATARFAMFGVGLREFVCCFWKADCPLRKNANMAIVSTSKTLAMYSNVTTAHWGAPVDVVFVYRMNWGLKRYWQHCKSGSSMLSHVVAQCQNSPNWANMSIELWLGWPLGVFDNFRIPASSILSFNFAFTHWSRSSVLLAMWGQQNWSRESTSTIFTTVESEQRRKQSWNKESLPDCGGIKRRCFVANTSIADFATSNPALATTDRDIWQCLSGGAVPDGVGSREGSWHIAWRDGFGRWCFVPLGATLCQLVACTKSKCRNEKTLGWRNNCSISGNSWPFEFAAAGAEVTDPGLKPLGPWWWADISSVRGCFHLYANIASALGLESKESFEYQVHLSVAQIASTSFELFEADGWGTWPVTGKLATIIFEPRH